MNRNTVSFNNVFLTEVKKLKRSAVWLVIIGIPVVSVLIGTGNYVINQAALHGTPWINLWTQVALFYGYFFYPISISIIAAYLWRLEHSGTNWNFVKTMPVSSGSVWFTNLLTLFILAFLTQIVMVFAYWFMGTFVLHFKGTVPINIFWYLIAGPVCIMSTGSIQLYISLRVKSFSAPIAVCFLGCFIGLYCYMKGFWFFPTTLSIIGINAQHAELPSLIETLEVLFGVAFWTTLSSVLGVYYLENMETK